MTHSQRFRAILELLLPWSELWAHSVLHRFSPMEERVPEEWFHYGSSSDLSMQYALGQGEGDVHAPCALQAWVKESRNVCVLLRTSDARGLQRPFDRGLTPKKRHEIEVLLAFLEEEGIQMTHVLEIGGGMGHLARHLALHQTCEVTSVDRDASVQRRGARILCDWPWRDALRGSVRLVSQEFPGEAMESPGSLSAWAVGLHTCGDLSWSQLELTGKGYSVLNVGCCYEKLDPARESERLRTAGNRDFPITSEALFLANRGGTERSFRDFLFQQRVQRYRFGLEALLQEEGWPSERRNGVGSPPAGVYRSSFADYVRDRSGSDPAILARSDRALESFYRSQASLIEKQRFTAFLRNAMARPLELALLSSRAIHVESEFPDARVRMIQLFDPRISPRNVALVCQKHDPRP